MSKQMGCFNAVCQLSGKSIQHGNRCWFFILVPYYYDFSGVVEKVSIGNSILFAETFKPVLLPIIGIYNDYGGLEAVEHNYTYNFVANHALELPENLIEQIISGNLIYSHAFILEKYVKAAIKSYRSSSFPFYYERINWKDCRDKFIEATDIFKSFLMCSSSFPHHNLIRSSAEFEYFRYELDELKSHQYWRYLEKLVAIELAMRAMNRIWLPTIYGGQFNNSKWMMQFLK